jgi:hypothetical protein
VAKDNDERSPDYTRPITLPPHTHTIPLPLRYYWHNVTTRFTLPGGGTTIELEVLMYDSVVMCGNFLEDEGEGHLLSELTGPANATLAKEQLAWLTKRMAASTADYLWVRSSPWPGCDQ